MASFRTLIRDPVAEGSSPRITATLVDQAGVPIAAASLTTLTWTNYDRATLAIVNTRDAVNILNVNGGTVDVLGQLVLLLDPADTALLDVAGPTVVPRQQEPRCALLKWTWASGTKAGRGEIWYTVANLARVP